MTALRLFHYIEPFFCGGLLDDPLLLVRLRPTGRSLLFDCGQLHHLAKRTLRSIDAVFVTHAHMDHFMGLDILVRHTHVSPRPLHLYGPPGFAARVGHKLAGYEWNLAEPWWRSIFVHEVHKKRLDHYLFTGSRGFDGELTGSAPHDDDIIYGDNCVTVTARLVDHVLPALAFRLNERDIFAIDPNRMAAEKLVPGPWVRELKHRWKTAEWQGAPLTVIRSGTSGPSTEPVPDVEGLYQRLRADRPAASIGYVTDLGFTEANRQTLREQFTGISLFCCECSFLAADQAKARASYHLCSSDLNQLLCELGPKAVLPMHLSKSYLRQPQAVYEEITPPPGTHLLRLPDYLTPRPKLLMELPPVAGFPERTYQY